MKYKTTLFYITAAATVVALCVVVLGAYTRLVHAGLGCPDWPTCYGHLWVPSSDEDIARANARFADTPVETHKTWPEQSHRILASFLGLIVLSIFVIALRARRSDHAWISVAVLLSVLIAGTVARVIVGAAMDPYLWLLLGLYFLNLVRLCIGQSTGNGLVPFKLPALLAGFVVLQGLFGMWTVTLKLWPQVVMAHLLGGFATLAMLWLLLQRLGQLNGFWCWRFPSMSVMKLLKLQPLAVAAVIAVVLQVALGGWTSANYAALACPDFPSCQNQWFPEADFFSGFNFFQQLGPNYLGGLLDSDARTAIHFSHRLGALVVLLVCGILIYRLLRVGTWPTTRMGLILIAALALQIGLGIGNVLLALPLAVAVAHNFGGAVLLLVLITVNHRIFSVKTAY